MEIVFESAALDLSSSNPLVIEHNLGFIPTVYSVYRVVDGEIAPFEINPNDFAAGTFSNPPVVVESFTASTATISVSEGSSFSGPVKLICHN